jgi:hypothetical protein
MTAGALDFNLGLPKLVAILPASGATRVFGGKRIRSFASDDRVHARSVAGGALYGVNHPGVLAATQVVRFIADGVKTNWVIGTDLPSIITATQYHGTGALTQANVLDAIVCMYPDRLDSENQLVLERVAGDVSPSTFTAEDTSTQPQWRVLSATGPVYSIDFGAAPAAGRMLELIVPTTITTITTLSADVTAAIKVKDFMAAAAATELMPVNR